MICSIGFRASPFAEAKALKLDSKRLAERLGGKGAGLVEMTRLGLPVPPAINLSTELCQIYLLRGSLPSSVMTWTMKAIQGMEKNLNREFGSDTRPLLVSVRSGAPISMPGMMDTILNLGLNTKIVEALSGESVDQARFWWDCYRRFIVAFAEVVLKERRDPFERKLERAKNLERVIEDSKLSAESLKDLSLEYLSMLGSKFPQDPGGQLKRAIEAVFQSWNTERALHYRQLNRIPEHWGTAVNIQAMVFGNRNERSATGVVFTRNPSTGEKKLYGEYLINAQGEDVVAGIRTPESIEGLSKRLPKAAKELHSILKKLEGQYAEVQDVEFTIDDGRLFILQTRTAKRTAAAAVKHAIQFVSEKKLRPEEALFRLSFDQVKQMLHPSLQPTKESPLGKGLPASPGAVSGKLAFDAEAAVQMNRAEQRVILVRKETSPEDIVGMSASEGILTATGGMTSHAAVVGRGMGKSCVVGCQSLQIDESRRELRIGDVVLREGDVVTLNGSTGEFYRGELPTLATSWSREAEKYFGWADRFARMQVLTNADTPVQCQTALELGAKGIGLCRTEHMFFEPSRLRSFRRMILTEDQATRLEEIQTLRAHQTRDFIEIFRVMNSRSVCVRLLDPPLHEFLPKLEDEAELRVLSEDLGMSPFDLKRRLQSLEESNPMLGHRGCRLGISFPEVYQMQVLALVGALATHLANGGRLECKIMLPLIVAAPELDYLLSRLKRLALSEVPQKFHSKLMKSIKWGSMIELPRACMVAGDLAKDLDFVSFGTNDLTQTGLGISRDDSHKFMSVYLEKGLFPAEPFEQLDQEGIGQLIRFAVEALRKANPKIEIGVCGEHAGDPSSIEFFEQLGFDTISCSPYRVPVARLAAARAVLQTPVKSKLRRTAKKSSKKGS
ncbi:MAG: pyruvate, phosphate dikinase [Bradymonadales bacterium]|nr:MAG: pyruvate, phosphate dikinase [Bradymonadales bacterium]